MPVNITAPNPATLLASIKAKIDQGKIATWSYEGDRFDYLPKQYAHEAVLDASIEPKLLKFQLKWKKQATRKTNAMIAIYYGRFMEEILSHFTTKDFVNLWAPPLR
jgi:hypothetical protein